MKKKTKTLIKPTKIITIKKTKWWRKCVSIVLVVKLRLLSTLLN